MGLIINPRGTGGAGETTLARRIMRDFGPAAPIHRSGRDRPIGYRLLHPAGARPLAVLGAYEANRGGCDTIPAAYGGLDAVFHLASAWAAEGHHVLFEGLLLSGEHRRSAALAGTHPLHILRMMTPLEGCIRTLITWRRAGREGRRSLAHGAVLMDAEIEAACRLLRRSPARVEVLGFDGALRRARGLLGLRSPHAAPDAA